jgi:Putative prokaryotic signal transducing protein
MKMLFSSSDRAEATLVRKKLFEAGIRCEVRHNPVAQGVFGVPSYPELWVNHDGDILKALRLLGTSRLRQMTVVF